MISQRTRLAFAGCGIFGFSCVLLSSSTSLAASSAAPTVPSGIGVATTTSSASDNSNTKDAANKSANCNCDVNPPPGAPVVPAGVPLASATPLPTPQYVVTVESVSQKAVVNQAHTALQKKDYPAIEAELSRLAKTKSSYADGTWLLGIYASGLSSVPLTSNDGAWVRKIKELRAWMTARPHSGWAPIVLAQAYLDGAWRARGSGYADSIPENHDNLIDQRIASASDLLTTHQSVRKYVPLWYGASLKTLQLIGAPKQIDYAVFHEAVANGFADTSLYSFMIFDLQERWYGDPGEWQQFVNDAAKAQPTGTAGDIACARLAWMTLQYPEAWPVYTKTHLKWDRVKAGFQALVAQYPDSLPAASAFAICAVAAGDRATTNNLITTSIKNRVDRATWSLDNYKGYVVWSEGIHWLDPVPQPKVP